MREHEHRPVLDGELEEGPLDRIAIGQAGDGVERISTIDGLDRDLEQSPARLADVVRAGADEQSVEPGAELVAIAQRAQIAPGPDERFLDGIFRGIPIAEDAPGDRVQAVVRSGREDIEGLVIAPLCAFDELGRHPDSSVRRGHLPRSPSMASPSAQILH